MTYDYTLDTLFLDLGDIGQHPAMVEGSVAYSRGTSSARVDKVLVFIESRSMDVTKLVSRAALTDLEEALEAEHERDHAVRGA